MRTFVVTLLLAFTVSAGAVDRTATIQTLMEAQGLLQMWDQQIALSKQLSQQQAQQLLDQMLTSLTPTPEFEVRFRDAFDEYMKDLQPRWTAQDVVDVWAQKYGTRFTDQELDDLIAYYTSPLGKKDVAATQAAMPEFMDYFMELSKPIAEVATNNYIQRLRTVAQDCQCQKR